LRPRLFVWRASPLSEYGAGHPRGAPNSPPWRNSPSHDLSLSFVDRPDALARLLRREGQAVADPQVGDVSSPREPRDQELRTTRSARALLDLLERVGPYT